MHFPGYSLEAAHFLVESRNPLGLGIDTLSVDYSPSKDLEVHQYTEFYKYRTVGSHLGPCRKSSNRYRKFAHPQELERDTVTIRNLIPDFVALTGERFLATLGRV